MLKYLLLTLSFISINFLSQAQIDRESFNYSTGDVTLNPEWSTAQGGGTFSVISPGLTYAGYPSSGVGNALNMPPNAGVAQKNHGISFIAKSGTIYMAFMVKLNAVNTSNDYFAAFSNSQSSTGVWDRIFIRDDGSGNIRFGVNPNFGTSPDVNTGFSYKLDTTYIVVLKHEFNAAQQYDDEVSLFVINGTIPATEPAPTLGPVSDGSGTSDPDSLAAVSLMSRNTTQDIDIDGIRVATNWADLFTGTVGLNEEQSNNIVTLGQNKPNPASGTTVIPYEVAQSGVVDVTVYDAIGNVVASPVNGVNKSKGSHSVQVNVSALQPGIYFYSIKQDGYVETKKMVVGP